MRREVAKERPLQQGTSVVMSPLVAGGPSPSGVVQDNEREAALRLAISTLDPTDQRIVMLRTYKQQQFDAIGQEVGMKADTARVRYSRALARLSQKLLALNKGDFDEFLA
jgi:RNA polymerase sigma factor (sigma-70 family)